MNTVPHFKHWSQELIFSAYTLTAQNAWFSFHCLRFLTDSCPQFQKLIKSTQITTILDSKRQLLPKGFNLFGRLLGLYCPIIYLFRYFYVLTGKDRANSQLSHFFYSVFTCEKSVSRAWWSGKSMCLEKKWWRPAICASVISLFSLSKSSMSMRRWRYHNIIQQLYTCL